MRSGKFYCSANYHLHCVAEIFYEASPSALFIPFHSATAPFYYQSYRETPKGSFTRVRQFYRQVVFRRRNSQFARAIAAANASIFIYCHFAFSTTHQRLLGDFPDSLRLCCRPAIISRTTKNPPVFWESRKRFLRRFGGRVELGRRSKTGTALPFSTRVCPVNLQFIALWPNRNQAQFDKNS